MQRILYSMQVCFDTISGDDGPVTISGFDQTNDKIVILASAMPVGYDLDD